MLALENPGHMAGPHHERAPGRSGGGPGVRDRRDRSPVPGPGAGGALKKLLILGEKQNAQV
jgi:hypothetical protein